MSACSICEHADVQRLEELGLEALQGTRSWRSAARDCGLTHAVSLKNHMEKHFVAHQERAAEVAEQTYGQLLQESVEELQQQMSLAPPDIKPLYAIAIQNLVGLADTKPSQQHLIAALKAIHEITGMKNEQRLLLDYAKSFGAIDAREVPKVPQLLPPIEVG